jgi:phosphoribosylformimino-5-aminoimidazole carboxamide ribotide isomerase
VQVIAAIDIRDNACVQLVGGSYAHERVRLPDPVAVAKKWARLGFGRVHLVDLDAATGRGSNRRMMTSVLGALPTDNGFRIQCGGGVRDLEAIAELLDAGASEVVVGTRAIEDRAWLEDAVSRYPDRLVVAADARAGQLVTRGWSEIGSVNVTDFVDQLGALPLAGILVTAVEREGRMEGPDLALMRQVALRSLLPVQASGGVRGIDDLRQLAAVGVSAAIVGMALYTGALDPQTIIEEFPA